MIAEKLLGRLEMVRQTSQKTWIARCPAHEDNSPSLSIREADDRLLLHCFAGCPIDHIVHAAGLEISDLYPESPDYNSKRPLGKPFPVADVLRCISQELCYMQIYATELEHGVVMNEHDKSRMRLCASRIAAAVEVARV